MELSYHSFSLLTEFINTKNQVTSEALTLDPSTPLTSGRFNNHHHHGRYKRHKRLMDLKCFLNDCSKVFY